MDNDNIFTHFCRYVDETIFSDEKRGEVVAFIVDQTYIDDFCKANHTTEPELLRNARVYLYQVIHSTLYARGIIALQVYAATKRANSDGITDRNYNDRLVDLLFVDLSDLQRWYADYQDEMWRRFYSWCDSNNFLISRKCYQGYGYGRYTQYPLQEARRVFTTEALLNFARAFVDNKLTPEDDFSYNTFWKLIIWRELGRYIDSSNAKRIYENKEYEDDAKQQIYNFFLRWNGDYKEANYSRKQRKVSSVGNILYLPQNLSCVDVRDSNYKLIASFPISSLRYGTLADSGNRIAIKRQGIFLFKWDNDYQIWEETRFVEAGEVGIAMVFPESTVMAYAFRKCELLLQYPRIKLFRITEKTAPDFCYTERKTCYLEGGLKVGRNLYLEGGAPFLIREKAEKVRIDTEPIGSMEERLNLNYLKEGTHTIIIPGRKSIKFELLEPRVDNIEWNSKFAQWLINKRDALWQSSRDGAGVSGMDFCSICKVKSANEYDSSPSRLWAKCFINESITSENAAIKTLKKILDYEIL